MRQCGDCTLCCTLVPVRELNKLAGQRCQFQKFHKGCTVYNKPAMPPSCSLWGCRWLVNDDTNDLSRPDRSRLVIDIMPDYVTLQNNDTGDTQDVEVIQVWCDPKHRDAHRDPQFRRWVERRAAEGKAVIVRFSSADAVTLFAPSISPDGRWHEATGKAVPERSLDDVIQHISEARQ